MKFHKILIIGILESALDKKYWDKINEICDEKVFLPKDSPEIKKELPSTDCILAGFGVTVTKDDMELTPGLKYIGVYSTAYGKIDTGYAKKEGIVVCNIPGYSTEAVAEFSLAVILDQLRNMEAGKLRGRNRNYSEEGLKGAEIKNKVFGILGLGSIGARIAEIAQAFGADVRYWSRTKKLEPKGIKYEPADTLIEEANILSINLTQTPDTEKFLNAKRIQSLKPGAIVINTAPMELVDIKALAKRLKKEDITFIFDHSDETSKEDLEKLSKFENCIIYPPMAYFTEESGIRKPEIFLSNIENFLKGKPLNKVT